MHRVDGPGNVAGHWVAEDPENNIPGTQITEDIMEALQEEVCAVIESRGKVLNKSNNNQLLESIMEIASGADLIARYATIGNISLTGAAVQAGGDWPAVLPNGTIVLVRAQTIPQDNGPYVVNATGAWSRLNTFDSSAEISPGKTIKVTEGVTLADSIWMLVTDAPIVLNSTALVFERKDAASGVKYFASGTALPSSNIGPIWHDDYNSIMTWQAFTANGAAYTGYASVLVGSLLLDAQPTPRTGYVKNGTSNLNRTTYAALRGWAMHNGVMVALGVWSAGMIAVADNGDGTTFRIYDVRGEFPRFWDDGRGVDSGRVWGSGQADMLKAHDHPGGTSPYTGGYVNASGTGPNGYNNVGSTGGSETRPRNVAMLGAVKF
ncbi:hypothetical protein [Methylophilus sp. DW102]|uniref:hypothetical protein n=1 Tax=Methylophilus sp. DW102 TaxID=3095607 RepID=UPI003089ED89|nr:phage tail protein [Methylophilus sp. DW102]BEV09306.1 phage tail protein [Methylophilus sp. DW102]